MSKQETSHSLDMSAWIDQRQSKGLYYFTREEALKTLNTSETALKQAATRLIKKKRIVRVYSGFFIIVPLEYAATGVLPAEWFITDLMDYAGQPYYVGLLSAAVFHGAAHQQPQEFQVITNSPLRKIEAGNLSIRFFTKKNFFANLLILKIINYSIFIEGVFVNEIFNCGTGKHWRRICQHKT